MRQGIAKSANGSDPLLSGAMPHRLAIGVFHQHLQLARGAQGDLLVGVVERDHDLRRQLLRLSGRTHRLNSALVLARGGEVLWRHVSVATLTMRSLNPAFVGRYLARVGGKALSSVGAYQIEGEGIQLFEKIEGDHFTILGLPLLPLLAFLRGQGLLGV